MTRAPYVLFILDGTLANYAGVSPDEPIGEPFEEAWVCVHALIDYGYDVVILTWRDPGLVNAWMERGKMGGLMGSLACEVRKEMPPGLPVCWVTDRDGVLQAWKLPRRRPA